METNFNHFRIADQRQIVEFEKNEIEEAIKYLEAVSIEAKSLIQHLIKDDTYGLENELDARDVDKTLSVKTIHKNGQTERVTISIFNGIVIGL